MNKIVSERIFGLAYISVQGAEAVGICLHCSTLVVAP